MVSEHILLALLKPSEQRTNAEIELIANFCRLFTVFNDIPEHLFNAFCRIIEIEEYESGAVVYNEGDIGSDWFIIIEGTVNVVSNASSTNPVSAVMKIGDQFGRNALEQDVIRAETITCTSHVYLLRVNRRPYQEITNSASSGLDGEGQAFANEFLCQLNAIQGMNIATSICRRVFPSNTVIMKQNEETEGIFYILKGSAAVVREVEFKENKVPVTRLIEIDELVTGAIFGVRSLCLGTPENVSVIAKCELTTLFLSRSDFFRKVDTQKQKQCLPADYPDDATIRKLFRKQMKWEQYKKKVVREVLQHKKAKKELRLQY
ncbi:cyclic nucleotide-binding domain containing protein [Trichomonas vaginalis G3]|uniref:Cyclic nucleotide-binding domain containing protein n=1 Tax=Trichomonas vaginalis (strain ATCC PRA-98 / G3) TaxID=412133 RepID=A2DQ79_TRIV3|nr:positive regulation of potassium:proton exchanging ATPase protein [Trichomonas vaginalis G3]EAY17506.1 cyclic nucleotide-binding domain containing protein [Trichomonas vaginalis G3]KAI5533611.1 positive regulation of potassium:proton exchanging ATPase protein [Trichomonas vaginalis G3]|eukprot:XP_001329641.1 cyclic nucleotide-binding domain containing protein [Trichomonas vaginalis G3]